MKSKPQTRREFTERDIQLMISNPVYAGIEIFPAMVPEEMCIAAAIVAIKERGSGFWLDVHTNIIGRTAANHNSFYVGRVTTPIKPAICLWV